MTSGPVYPRRLTMAQEFPVAASRNPSRDRLPLKWKGQVVPNCRVVNAFSIATERPEFCAGRQLGKFDPLHLSFLHIAKENMQAGCNSACASAGSDITPFNAAKVSVQFLLFFTLIS